MLRVFVLIAAIGGAASTWLPWRIMDDTIRDGWHASGAVSFGAFCIAAVCGAYRPLWFVRIALFVLGMIALVGAAKTVGEIGVIQRELATSFDAAARREASQYRVGLGAWLTLAASLGLIFSAFLWKRPKPGVKPAMLPRATIVSLLLLSGCELIFPLSDPPSDTNLIPHIPTEIFPGTGDFKLIGGLIDTQTNSIGIDQPGVQHDLVAQSEGGMVMLIRARDVRLDGTVRVQGSVPLIIFARTITVDRLEASAMQATSGPGAVAQGGGDGGSVLNNNAGGGGGGFGRPGAAGGHAGDPSLPNCANGFATPGIEGQGFGDDILTTLEGGSSGGLGGASTTDCVTPGGGGGGAIQLSAVERIVVTGGIHANGGGGAGGVVCKGGGSHGGAGGGAGGAIYLDAPTIEIAGAITANGGGGGGGGGTDTIGQCALNGTQDTAPGGPGGDGRRDDQRAGGGVAGAADCAKDGGLGGAEAEPTAGDAIGCDGSAGGGGGGVGRIVVRGALSGVSQLISPAPTVVAR